METVASLAHWSVIESQLPSDFRALAARFGLLRPMPPHLGAQLEDVGVLLRMILYRVGTGSSLKVTVATAAAGSVAGISHVALHKWEKKVGPYLAALGARMVDAEASFSADRWAGYEVIACDATTVQHPGSKGTTARVHYAMRLSDLAPVHAEATDASGGETFRRFDPRDGQLWLADRGYCNAPGLAFATARGAHVIVRLNRGTLPLFDEAGGPFELMRRLRSMRATGVAREWKCVARARGSEPVEGRLCAVRLPRDKAEAARRRLQREHGAGLDAETLEAAQYVVVFTTVPSERLSAEQVLELYRLRWQIEIEFKRDKSIGDLDALPNFRADTIHTWLCAHLILQAIARRLATATSPFFPGAVARALLEGDVAAGAGGAARAGREARVAGDDLRVAGAPRRATAGVHRAVA